MRNFEQLSERILVAPGGANIGIILAPGDKAILIDTGLNDTAARKVLRGLAEMNRQVAAIVTTHGHADHFGGNAFVVRRSNAEVWAPVWDETVLRYPLFQPLVLFAGADPPDSLRGGFLVAEQSPVDHIYDAGPFEVSSVRLEAVSLAGHSGNQLGILCDDVFFSADIVLPERVLSRYKMPYLFSVRDHLKSLDRAAEVDYAAAMPGHGPIVADLSDLLQMNTELVLRVAEMVVEACASPTAPADILAEVLTRLDAEPADAASYYLLHPTVFAYLTHLEEQGRVTHKIENARSLWTSS